MDTLYTQANDSSSREWWCRDESDFILDSWGSTTSPEMKFPYEIKNDGEKSDFKSEMGDLIARIDELRNDLIAVEKYKN